MRSLALGALLAVPGACATGTAPAEDSIPPTLRILRPREGERLAAATTPIEIEYSDTGGGILVWTFKADINGENYSASFDHHVRGATGRVPSSQPLPLGENVLTVEVADRAGNAARATVRFFNASGGWLHLATVPGVQKRRSVELILDASGSMDRSSGLSDRMEVAKEAIRTLLDLLPADIHLGLRVFRDCQDIELLVPVGPLDREAFLAQLEAIQPAGRTPIVASLLESFDSLGRISHGEKLAVLITDGAESCGGDLLEAANRATDTAIRVIVIGFEITQDNITEQLRRLAEGTEGSYFDARDPDQLRIALEESIVQVPFDVLDAAGKVVAAGNVNGSRVELAPGVYQVRVHAVPRLIVRNVPIEALADTRIELRPTPTGLQPEVRTTAEGRGSGGSP